jgi:hypothetical protein
MNRILARIDRMVGFKREELPQPNQWALAYPAQVEDAAHVAQMNIITNQPEAVNLGINIKVKGAGEVPRIPVGDYPWARPSIYTTHFSCAVRTLYGVRYLMQEATLGKLVYFSKYPGLIKGLNLGGKGLTSTELKECLYLEKGIGYIMSSYPTELRIVKALVEKYDLGQTSLTHTHKNYNYSPGGGSEIGVLYWTWNGNTIPAKRIKELDPSFKYNDEGIAA